ncbi:stage II sporulation protein B [Anoxybacillus sp. J5B_2022]|uniref:stage II sporulation protein B n=1 Tax=Anoxybacillus sp. J5B_2022 TaxID=3003246 RepID=UPI0022854985|nr:stage II sporulation protein B [Anoxybacillus sp. J5B_2022]MCZ0756675.1 stage II sporulation protein B [Anoxybacillus sp. J5B_2022]
MDKQAKITVKINGEDRPFMMEKIAAENEISAAIEEEEAPAAVTTLEKTPAKPMKRMLHTRVKTALFSILLAVIIGTSFGFIVLHIVPKQKETASLPLSPVSLPKETPAAKEVAEPLTVAIIQAGVFSEKKAAEAYAKQLQASQIPAVLVGTKPIAVWIGVGADKPSLAPLVEQFKQKGLTTYVKPLVLSSIQEETVQALYTKMANISAQLLANADVSEAEWTSLETSYKKVQKKSEQLESAYVSLIAYRKQKETPLLWNVQQNLLAVLQKENE